MNARAIGITPHMHYIGKEMKVVAGADRRRGRPVDLDQGLGFQLARAVSISHSSRASQGNRDQARRLLRQLQRQCTKPKQTAEAGPLGRADNG